MRQTTLGKYLEKKDKDFLECFLESPEITLDLDLDSRISFKEREALEINAKKLGIEEAISLLYYPSDSNEGYLLENKLESSHLERYSRLANFRKIQEEIEKINLYCEDHFTEYSAAIQSSFSNSQKYLEHITGLIGVVTDILSHPLEIEPEENLDKRFRIYEFQNELLAQYSQMKQGEAARIFYNSK